MQTIRKVVYEILRKTGKPMHIVELSVRVRKIRPIKGKTPKKTINAICQRHDKIERIGSGTFKCIK